MPGLFDLDLPDNTNDIQVNKPVKKKKATKKKILDIHDVEEITRNAPIFVPVLRFLKFAG